MRKTIFVLLSLLLTLTGCSKETLPETSSVPSEDTHITSPTEEKTEQNTTPASEPTQTTEAPEETAASTAENGTSDSSVKEPKQNTASNGPTEPTEKTDPAESAPAAAEPAETTPTMPNASASDAGAIAELVAQYLNDYRTAQGTAAVTRLPVLRDMPNTAAAKSSRTSHTTLWMNERRQRHCPMECMWILPYTEWTVNRTTPLVRAKQSPRPDMLVLSIMWQALWLA